MYAGRILEEAPPTALLRTETPYNQALQRAIPALNEKGAELATIPGAPPDVSARIEGCPFAPRCEYALEKCRTSQIALKEVIPGHFSACLRIQLGEIDLAPAHARKDIPT